MPFVHVIRSRYNTGEWSQRKGVAVYCNACGNQLSDDARFCPRCGAPVANQPIASDAGATPPNNQSRMRVVVAALVGCTLGLALVVGVLTFLRANEHPQIAVSIPLEVPGLDEEGTRVPVQATGTSAYGDEVSQVAYLEPDGSGLLLAQGSYEIQALGSPIASDGTIYEVAQPTMEVILDDEAVASGKTANTTEPLVFTPIDASDLTEDQIAAALEWAEADGGRDARKAQELADVARKSCEGGAGKSADKPSTDSDKSEDKATDKTADSPSKTDDKSATSKSSVDIIHLDGIDFAMPTEWDALQTQMGDNRFTLYYGSEQPNRAMIVSVDQSKDQYWWHNGAPDQTLTLSNGNTLGITTKLDDGGVAGRITDAQGRRCDLITIKYDGKEFGGGPNAQTDLGQQGQMIITGSDFSGDPRQLAFETLRVVAEHITLV